MFPFLAGAGYWSGDFWSSVPLQVVALTGAFTAFFAATIAFAQTDIKKVLAYSTVSQLGYMMLGIGRGGARAGALPPHHPRLLQGPPLPGWLGHPRRPLERDGPDGRAEAQSCPSPTGPSSSPPWPSPGSPSSRASTRRRPSRPRSSTPSSRPSPGSRRCSTRSRFFTAGLTAFYMFRLWFYTFAGKPRDQHIYDHCHESPWIMTGPLLAFSSF